MNMPTSSNKSFGQPASNVGDDLAGAADRAAGNAQRTVENVADSLSSKIQDVRDQAAPLINRVSAQAEAAARRGIDAVRDSSAQLREKAQKATDTTVAYVKDEPVKSMLIAAATGAVLMGLVSLMGRSRND